VSAVTGIARSTIRRRLAELGYGKDQVPGRIRRPGGGRRLKTETEPGLLDAAAGAVWPVRWPSAVSARVRSWSGGCCTAWGSVADLEAKLNGPPKTPGNSSLPPSRGQKPNWPEKGKHHGPRPGSEIETIAAFTAMGNVAPKPKVRIEAGLNVGLSRQEIMEAIMQMAVYAGFPAALNGLFAAKAVFARQVA